MPTPLTGWRKHVYDHLYFWLTVPGVIWVFFKVPQIAHIWQQTPPPQEAGLGLWLGYWAFVIGALWYYVLSPLVVVPGWDDFITSCHLGFLRRGPFRLLSRPVELSVRWLPALVPARPGFGVGLVGVALLAAGAMIGWKGAAGDGSRWYLLGGAFCCNVGLLAGLTGLWLLRVCLAGELRPGQEGQGRVLAWLIVTNLLGELVWWLGCGDVTGQYVSFRLYTIGCAVHLLILVTVVADLVDYWHVETGVPIRQLALLIVPAALYFAMALPARDATYRHLSAAERASATSQAEDFWYTRFQRRIEEVPVAEGPVVIVAASGGGSRAAIFTALALETLARTPVATTTTEPSDAKNGSSDATPRRTLADNIVLISSVSGGSLASARYVQRGGGAGPERDRLRNTTKSELLYWMMQYSTKLVAGFDEEVVEKYGLELAEIRRTRQATWQDRETLRRKLASGDDETVERQIRDLDKEIDDADQLIARIETRDFCQALTELLRAGKDESSLPSRFDAYRWIMRSGFMDEMCEDFMAPILRGVLTPSIARGDTLLRLWQERFAWRGVTDQAGYVGASDPPYDPKKHPIVFLNASDAEQGTRLAVGFPPIPAGLLRKPSSENDGHLHAGALRDRFTQWDCTISLAQAVRLSSNFPWGFHVAVLEPPCCSAVTDCRPVRVLDGGVVDNTGLDTLHEMFSAMAERAADHDAHASETLAMLRERGVVIFEIDSGAKPTRQRNSLLRGVTEPIAALNNATYGNAEHAKEHTVEELRQALNGTLGIDPSSAPDAATTALIESIEHKLPDTVFHVPFQCNHVPLDRETGEHDQDVMTAWALGPEDKARVLVRFLIELSLWESNLLDLRAGIRTNQELLRTAQSNAQSILDNRKYLVAARQARNAAETTRKLLLAPTDEPQPKPADDRITEAQSRVDESVKRFDQLKSQFAESGTTKIAGDAVNKFQDETTKLQSAIMEYAADKSEEKLRTIAESHANLQDTAAEFDSPLRQDIEQSRRDIGQAKKESQYVQQQLLNRAAQTRKYFEKPATPAKR